jgi:hypothetical protein
MNEKEELRNLVHSIPDFYNRESFKRVHILAWFLHTYSQIEEFTEEDIRRCLKHLDLPVALYLNPVPDSANIIKSATGYRLDWRTRDALDKAFGTAPISIEVHRLLKELPNRISIDEEREYLDEAFKCYSCEAYRAAIVMGWNGDRRGQEKHLTSLSRCDCKVATLPFGPLNS